MPHERNSTTRRSGSRRRALLAAIVAVVAIAAGALTFAGRRISTEQVAYSGPKAARCVPRHLNRSAVLRRTGLAVSPLPGSYDASPRTQISFLGAPAKRIEGITVTGSITGGHSGRLRAYSQGDGASFVPSKPFHVGERVSVSGDVRGAHRTKAFSFQFTVSYPDPIPTPAATPQGKPPAGSVESFRSAPHLHPPTVKVLEDAPSVAPGDIFLAPYSGPGSKGPAILDQQGQLIWMDALPGALKATNLQVETYEGKQVLTWWQGYIPPQGFGLGEEIVANTSYRPILRIRAGNGMRADLHDFHLEPHHTAVLTVFHTIHCDLTSVGGPRDGAVTDGLFQELDVKTGLVRREWTSVDHVPLSETYSQIAEIGLLKPLDFFHINTVDPRPDGSTLISSRNTSALWLIAPKTGKVYAKVGGRKSTVRMGPHTRTAFQHDAMTLPDGDISIFDNGGSPFGEPYSHTHSRGVIVDVSTKAGSDTLVRELNHSPPIPANSQGDVQPQPGGGWFVGWGQEPYYSEYDASGKLIYDAKMWAVKGNRPLETESYRTYKFPWHATPYWPPSIAVEGGGEHGGERGGERGRGRGGERGRGRGGERGRGRGGERGRERGGEALTVYASWNGATEVSSWRVLGGPSPKRLAPLATASKTGFETKIVTHAAPYVAVQALDAAGAAIGRSKTIKG